MCGVAGATGFNEVPASVVIHGALYAMQHRGQDGCGIASEDGDGLPHLTKGVGLVTDIFPDINEVARKFPGAHAVGHVRYATTGGARETANTQPITRHIRGVRTTIVYNGNLENYAELRRELEDEGAIFESTSDTEIFLHLMARARCADPDKQIIAACKKVKGAYTLLVQTPDRLVALRDPFGFRPLSMCRLDDKDKGVFFASETNAFNAFSRKSQVSETRSVRPGEIVVVDTRTGEVCSRQYARAPWLRQCSFEEVYFGRPDSDGLFDLDPTSFRIALGEAAAECETEETDLAIGVPDSGIIYTVGFAQARLHRMHGRALDRWTGKILTPEARAEIERPLDFDQYFPGITRSHYVKRVFIEAEALIRALKASIKHGPIRSVIRGKRLWVGDDSVVRADTAKKVVEFLRDMGAKEVHLRSAAPMVMSNCLWGIDTPEKDQLIGYAMKGDVERIKGYIGCDTLKYTPLDVFKRLLKDTIGEKFCFSCFDGKHPTNGVEPVWLE